MRCRPRPRACADPCLASGVAGELAVVYMALPYLRQRKLYTLEMPNALNFAFSVTALFRLVSLAYVFGLPMVRLLLLAAPSCLRTL